MTVYVQFQRALSYPVRALCLKTPREGSQTSIHCAVHEGIEEDSGKFFKDCKIAPLTNPLATDDEVAERLWQVSVQLVGLEKDGN